MQKTIFVYDPIFVEKGGEVNLGKQYASPNREVEVGLYVPQSNSQSSDILFCIMDLQRISLI